RPRRRPSCPSCRTRRGRAGGGGTSASCDRDRLPRAGPAELLPRPSGLLSAGWVSRPSLFALFSFRLGLLRRGLVGRLGLGFGLRSGRGLGRGLRGLLLGRRLFLVVVVVVVIVIVIVIGGLDLGLPRLGRTRLRLLGRVGRLVDDGLATGAL